MSYPGAVLHGEQRWGEIVMEEKKKKKKTPTTGKKGVFYLLAVCFILVGRKGEAQVFLPRRFENFQTNILSDFFAISLFCWKSGLIMDCIKFFTKKKLIWNFIERILTSPNLPTTGSSSFLFNVKFSVNGLLPLSSDRFWVQLPSCYGDGREERMTNWHLLERALPFGLEGLKNKTAVLLFGHEASCIICPLPRGTSLPGWMEELCVKPRLRQQHRPFSGETRWISSIVSTWITHKVIFLPALLLPCFSHIT